MTPKSSLILLLACAAASAQVVGNVAFFASGYQVNATQPAAVTVTADVFQQSIWISYANGTITSGGAGRGSLVVQYDTEGHPHQQYFVPGSVDGLEEDPASHFIWALENDNGLSALTLISPQFGVTPGSPLPYAIEYRDRGYRDVAFFHGKAFFSFTNTSPDDLRTVEGLAGLTIPLEMSDVVFDQTSGINIATGATAPTSQMDPGSLRLTPWNGVMLVSDANGQLIFIRNIGTAQQALGFLNVVDSSGAPVTGVADALFPQPGQNLFFLTNPTTNLVLLIYVYDVAPGQLFALVDSLGALVKIDLRTGVATPVLPHLEGFERMSALQIPGEIH